MDGIVESKYEIQRSVFICTLRGIENFDDGMNFVKEVSKKYSDATHNCYAITAKDGQQKFSDDGEPQGTAGMPILQTLKKSGLTNVVAVVTRYFGGIKLGAGGLVASYTKSCSDAVSAANKVTVKLCDEGEILSSYPDYKRISDCVTRYGKINSVDFADEVKIRFSVPVGFTEELTEKLNELTAGKLCCKIIAQAYEKF